MDGFFDYIKKSSAPLDFFSWHIYALSPEEIAAAARFVRGYLDSHGYENAESYLTEMNFSYSLRSRPTLYQHTEFPADHLSAMILGQSSPVDMIFYYDLRQPCVYNNVFYRDPKDAEIKKMPGFAPMKFFGDLYRLGTRIETIYEEGQGIYALSSTDGENYGAAIASRGFEGKLDILLDAKEVTVTVQEGSNAPTESQMAVTNGKLCLDAKRKTVYYISF